MMCPSTMCVYRCRDDGSCTAPLDYILTKHCPIPPNLEEKLKTIKAIYPDSPLLWVYYLKRIEEGMKHEGESYD